MAIRSILRMGDPRLLQRSEEVDELPSASLRALVRDMLETMEANDGAGLAAPQIGEMRRVVVFGVGANPRYPDVETVPLTVLVNPIVEPLDDTLVPGWEGCLSVPGLRGLVPRYRSVLYRGKAPDGSHVEREAEGFHARVVQHECDHLDGRLYPMRINDLSDFGFEDELVESGKL